MSPSSTPEPERCPSCGSEGRGILKYPCTGIYPNGWHGLSTADARFNEAPAPPPDLVTEPEKGRTMLGGEGRTLEGPVPNYSEGGDLIYRERLRQVQEEGWTPEHDDSHSEGELAAAAAAYAYPGVLRTRDGRSVHSSLLWPWGDGWKPGDRIRDLTKAGALIAAEIDRLQRAKN